MGFPDSSVSKESACHARDPGLISGSGRSSGVGNGNPIQYSHMENPTDREAWCGLQSTGSQESDTILVTKPDEHMWTGCPVGCSKMNN